jgi:Rieske Fe-S protein
MSERDPEQRTVGPDGQPLDEQPAWRRDFPIDWPQDSYVGRRDFTKFLVLTSFAFVVGQICIGIRNWIRHRQGEPSRQQIATLDQISVGGTLSFHYPEHHDNCLLLRPKEGPLLAYDQRCTHLSCGVIPEWSDQLQDCRLDCPCHHGVFDMATGRPIAGPPRRPLTRITIEVQGNAVYATGVEERTV